MKKYKLLSFIKYQLNVELKDIDKFKTKNMIYVEIKKENKFQVLSLLKKFNIEYCEHLNNKYWICVED